MVDKSIGQSKPAGKEVEIAALGTTVRLDCETRGGIDLHSLLLSLSGRDDGVEIYRIDEFRFKEGSRIGGKTGGPKACP